MFKNPYFYDERGCLWWAGEICVLVFSALYIIMGGGSVRSWLVLLAGVLDLALYFYGRRVGRKNYDREDSFWLRKDDLEDESTPQDPTNPQ